MPVFLQEGKKTASTKSKPTHVPTPQADRNIRGTPPGLIAPVPFAGRGEVGGGGGVTLLEWWRVSTKLKQQQEQWRWKPTAPGWWQHRTGEVGGESPDVLHVKEAGEGFNLGSVPCDPVTVGQ